MSNGKWTDLRWKLSGMNGNSDTHVHPDVSCDKPVLSYLFPARILKTARKCCILLLKIAAFACIKPSLEITQFIFPYIIKTSKSPNPEEICQSQKMRKKALWLPCAYNQSSVPVIFRRMTRRHTFGQDGGREKKMGVCSLLAC